MNSDDSLDQLFGYPISCCSLAIRNQPLSLAFDRIARAGFRGVEIWHSHLAGLAKSQVAELAGLCNDLGLRVPVIAPYFSFTRGEEAWRQSLNTAEEALSAAKIFGAKKIRTFVDIGDDGLPSRRATEADWKAAREGLKRLCALDPLTEFVMETHKNTLADSVPSVLRLLEEVAAPNLRVNFQHNPDFLERGYLASLELLFDHVSHFHWQQVRPGGEETYLEEDGILDFAAVFRFLKERAYLGTASVEYCWLDVDETRLESACAYLRMKAP